MKHQSPALPDALQMPYRDAIKLNVWAGIAVLAAFTSRLLLRDSVGLAGVPRLGAALLPLVPGLLYVRAIWRWIRTLDEMQRQLQLEAVCFAALVMLLLVLTTDLLRTAGFGAHLNFGWEGYFAFTYFLWTLGLARANRRYR